MFHVPRAASHPRPLSPKKGVRGLELELGHVPSSNPSSASYTVNTPFGSSYTPENPDFFANYSVQPPRRPPASGGSEAGITELLQSRDALLTSKTTKEGTILESQQNKLSEPPSNGHP
jgi:hypothetical protein